MVARPLTSKQKAAAWEWCAIVCRQEAEAARSCGELPVVSAHTLKVIAPHLRGMAKRIRRRAKR